MNARRFHGDADGPDLVIDRASDDTPLAKRRGWTCGRCDLIWATEGEAVACCVAPDDSPAVGSLPANGRWPRLYTPD